MRAFTLTMFAVLTAAIVVLFFRTSSNKLAYVESNKLLMNYKGMQTASQAYQEKLKVWTANIDTLRSELQKEIEKYESTKTTLTPKEKELSEKLIQTRQKQFLDYQRSIEEKATREDQESTRAVLDKVNAYVKQYGEENGYDIIMAATESGNLVYAREGYNITEEILKGLNAGYN